MQTVTFKAGDTIISEGSEGDTAFLITSGSVEVAVGQGTKARVLGTLMRRYSDEGRSTAGAAQKNSAAFPLDASFRGKKKKGRKAEKKSAKEVALALDPQFD